MTLSTLVDQGPEVARRAFSPEDIATMRERGKKDLYFFAKAILGYNLLTPRAHGALCRFIVQTDRVHDRRLLLQARGHLKSTIFTISDTIRLLACDPEERILLAAVTAHKAERFLQEIKNHFERNPLLRLCYPEIIPPDTAKTKWSTKEILIPREGYWREPSIDTIGVGGAAESAHYTRIKVDDPIGEAEIRSDLEMESAIEWVSGLESLLVSPAHQIDVIGNRKRLDDVYGFLMDFYGGKEKPVDIGPYAQKMGRIAVFRREAIEAGEPIFPEGGFTKEFFDHLRSNAPERYAAQYANDPRIAGATVFDADDLRYFTLVEDREDGKLEGAEVVFSRKGPEGNDVETSIDVFKDLDVIAVCDPALSKTKKSCLQAILVLGKEKTGLTPRIFCLEAHVARYTPTDMIDLLLAMDKKWNTRTISVEKYGYQAVIEYWLEEKTQREHRFMPSLSMYPPKGAGASDRHKEDRIRGLQPLTRNHQIYVLPSQTELIEEFRFYPLGKHRDGLDAFAQCTSVFDLATDEEFEEDLRKHERAIVASIGADGYSVRKGSPLDVGVEEWELELNERLAGLA